MGEDVWAFKANRSRGIVPGIRTIDATMYRVIPSMVAFYFSSEMKKILVQIILSVIY